MYTLFDFISYSNGMLYALALVFVVGFLVFWEIMKPQPFKAFALSLKEDIDFLRQRGMGEHMRLARNTVSAAVAAGVYAVSVPVMFAQGLAQGAGRMVGAVSAAGWNPVEAYLAGRRKAKKRNTEGKDSGKKE